MELDTILVRYDAAPGDRHRPTCTPLYQTATFSLDSSEDAPQHDYSRSGNPTRDVFESQMRRLEGGGHALAYTSGVAALSAVFGLVRSGESILAGSDLYGGTVRLLARVFPRRGVAVLFGDPSDPIAFAHLADASTRIVHVETPTNPSLRIVDLAALSGALAERFSGLGVPPPLLSVDNTLMTPYLQRPLDFGAGVVVHSATKGLSGHADVTAGVVVTNDGALAEELAYLRNAEGTALAPFEALLLLRGLKTLAVRLDRQQCTAFTIASLLGALPGVVRVHYPGLDHHPGAAIHARQARGAGPVVSFELDSPERARAVARSLELFPLTVSFGAVGSSVCHPHAMSHASIPAELRAMAPPETLLRLSIGLEAAVDLRADLARAIGGASAAVGQPGARHVVRECSVP
jgi:cystathionine beta-lyase